MLVALYAPSAIPGAGRFPTILLSCSTELTPVSPPPRCPGSHGGRIGAPQAPPLRGEPPAYLSGGKGCHEGPGLRAAGLAQEDLVDGGEGALRLQPAADGRRVEEVLDPVPVHLRPELRRDVGQVLALLLVEPGCDPPPLLRGRPAHPH